MIQTVNSKLHGMRIGRFQSGKFMVLTGDIDRAKSHMQWAIYCLMASFILVVLPILYFAFQNPSDLTHMLNQPAEALWSITLLLFLIWLALLIPTLLVRFFLILLTSLVRAFIHKAPPSPSIVPSPFPFPESTFGSAALNELKANVECKKICSGSPYKDKHDA